MKRCILFTLSSLFIGATFATDLNEVYHMALENDPTFKAQQASFKASKQAIPQAIAKFLPNLNGQATTTGIHSGIPAQGNYNTKNYSLNLSQPVYRPEHWTNFDQARHVEKQALATLMASGQDLIVRVSEQYFAVLGAEDDLEFASAQRKAFARQLEQTKQRFEVGLIAITDVHEAQARHDSALANEIAAQNNVANQYEKLREITGIPVDTLAKLMTQDKTLLMPPSPEEEQTWVDTAQKHNLDIRAAQEASLVAKGTIANNVTGHLPKVDLSAQVARNKSAPPFDDLYGQKSINLTLSVPIFEGGGVTFRVKEAQARYVEALKKLDYQRKSAYSTTRQKYRGVLTQISQVKSLKQAVVSNESALKATSAAYEVGTRTIVDVLNAESSLLSAKRDYAKARYNYVLEGLRLKRAAGTLHAQDLYDVNALLHNHH